MSEVCPYCVGEDLCLWCRESKLQAQNEELKAENEALRKELNIEHPYREMWEFAEQKYAAEILRLRGDLATLDEITNELARVLNHRAAELAEAQHSIEVLLVLRDKLKAELAELRRKVGEWADRIGCCESANWQVRREMREEVGK